MYKKIMGFTLAETLIVLVILGIIASITIPAVIRNQMEAQNRTRIRKAMTVYDMALNKIVVENQLKSDRAVQDWAGSSCENSINYFKVNSFVKDENGVENLCKFKSADGVWWNITNVLNPTIGLRESDLDENVNSDTRFKLLSHFDQNGSLRVDDLAYEIKINGAKSDMQKLYNFVNNQKYSSDIYTDEQYNHELENLQNYYYTDCYVEGRNDSCIKYGVVNGKALYHMLDSQGNTIIKLTAGDSLCTQVVQSFVYGQDACNLYSMEQIELIQKDGTYKIVSKEDEDCTNWNTICDTFSTSVKRVKNCKKQCSNNNL